jgi:ketopantoate reductase
MLKILVVGAGAIGCFVGGRLAAAGHNVTLVGRAGHHALGLLCHGPHVYLRERNDESLAQNRGNPRPNPSVTSDDDQR